MVLEIVKYGNPVLRAKGAEIKVVDDKVRKLADDMIETMRAANGVGLAAQQIGVAVMMTVVDVAGVEDRPSEMFVAGKAVNVDDYMPLTLLNPVLELGEEKEEGVEGCLSFPQLSADILRSCSVKVQGMSIDGEPIAFEANGLLARALQHEVDHLNGILFIDRMSSAARVGIAGKLKRLQQKSKR